MVLDALFQISRAGGLRHSRRLKAGGFPFRSESTSYSYDGDGLRTKKTTSSGPRTHTWDIAAEIPEMIGDAASAYITGPDGLPVEQITAAGTVHYYHQDQLGSTRALTTSTGTVAATASYDAYGNVATSTGTTITPFGFAGQYTDSETGLQYLRARYYDPKTQNFLTRDPLAAQTRAPYNCADNNPTNKTDPTGRIKCIAIAVGGAAVLGGAARGGWLLGELWDTWNREDNISRAEPDDDDPPGDDRNDAAEAETREVDALLDATGKVHGNLPDPSELGRYNPEDLAKFRDELKASISTRNRRNAEYGADYGHTKRLEDERALLGRINKHLDR